MPEGAWLGRLLLRTPAAAAATPETMLRRRSAAWASTLLATLELARQGRLALAQEAAFHPIQVRPAAPAQEVRP